VAERRLGLTRLELEREVTWLLRRTPEDPSKLPTFLGEVLVSVLSANNAAIARQLGDQGGAPDEQEGF
jgi:hypothetical protein